MPDRTCVLSVWYHFVGCCPRKYTAPAGENHALALALRIFLWQWESIAMQRVLLPVPEVNNVMTFSWILLTLGWEWHFKNVYQCLHLLFDCIFTLILQSAKDLTYRQTQLFTIRDGFQHFQFRYLCHKDTVKSLSVRPGLRQQTINLESGGQQTLSL